MNFLKIKKEEVKGIVVYAITVLLMAIPIVLSFLSPSVKYTETKQTGFIFKQTKEVLTEVKSPFQITGLAAVYATILFTILLIRNRKTVIVFGDEKKINVKAVILYILDLFFLTTVCSLIPSSEHILFFNINCKTFMIVAILLSLIGMKSLSGYVWILVTICLVFNLNAFDKWGIYSVIYVLFAYMSIVSQVLVLNIFEFDINELFYDFGKYGNTVTGNMRQSINVTKDTVGKVAETAKSVVNKKHN